MKSAKIDTVKAIKRRWCTVVGLGFEMRCPLTLIVDPNSPSLVRVSQFRRRCITAIGIGPDRSPGTILTEVLQMRLPNEGCLVARSAQDFYKSRMVTRQWYAIGSNTMN